MRVQKSCDGFFPVYPSVLAIHEGEEERGNEADLIFGEPSDRDEVGGRGGASSSGGNDVTGPAAPPSEPTPLGGSGGDVEMPAGPLIGDNDQSVHGEIVDSEDSRMFTGTDNSENVSLAAP